jgi:hypothetical protein
MIFYYRYLVMVPFLFYSKKVYCCPIRSLKVARDVRGCLAYFIAYWFYSSKSFFLSYKRTLDVTALTYDNAEVALLLPWPM